MASGNNATDKAHDILKIPRNQTLAEGILGWVYRLKNGSDPATYSSMTRKPYGDIARLFEALAEEDKLVESDGRFYKPSATPAESGAPANIGEERWERVLKYLTRTPEGSTIKNCAADLGLTYQQAHEAMRKLNERRQIKERDRKFFYLDVGPPEEGPAPERRVRENFRSVREVKLRALLDYLYKNEKIGPRDITTRFGIRAGQICSISEADGGLGYIAEAELGFYAITEKGKAKREAITLTSPYAASMQHEVPRKLNKDPVRGVLAYMHRVKEATLGDLIKTLNLTKAEVTSVKDRGYIRLTGSGYQKITEAGERRYKELFESEAVSRAGI